MPTWRAVAFGVSVQVLTAFLAYLVPVVGHVMVGLGGGVVAGALAGGRTRGGAENGLATGVVGGLLVGAVTVAALLAVGGFSSPVSTVLADLSGTYDAVLDLSRATLVALGTVLLVVAATLGGALGGAVRGDARLPTLPPEERTREREGER